MPNAEADGGAARLRRAWRALRGRAATAFAAAALCAVPDVGAAAEPPLAGWEAALMSGSDRLALYALLRAGPTGTEALAVALGHGIGVPHRGPSRIGAGAVARPILRQDMNFNGGIPGRTVEIIGIPFEVAPGDRARAGLVAGAEARAWAVFGYAEASTLALNLQGRAEGLLGQGLRRADAGASACLSHHLGDWTWIDSCARTARAVRSWGPPARESSLSLGLTRIDTFAGIDQQSEAALIRRRLDSGRLQTGAEVRWLGALSGAGAVSLGLDWAGGVEGEQTRVNGLTVGLTRPVLGAPMRFALDLGRSSGAQVFGVRRQDHAVALSVERPLTRDLALRGVLGRTRSNIDAYEDWTGGLTFELRR